MDYKSGTVGSDQTAVGPLQCIESVVSATMNFLNYWNLRERPFEATWDTRFYFQSKAHEEALNRLCFLVGEQSMNMGMLTGEIGAGKTLTRAVFAQRLDPEQFYVFIQENSTF